MLIEDSPLCKKMKLEIDGRKIIKKRMKIKEFKGRIIRRHKQVIFCWGEPQFSLYLPPP